MPTATTALTSLWTPNSPQLHLHSPTSPPAPCTGHCSVLTRSLRKKWDVIKHIPVAPSTSTAGELGPLPTQLRLGCVLLSICLPPASGFLQDGSSRPFRRCSVIAKEAYVCFLVFSFVFLTPQVFH